MVVVVEQRRVKIIALGYRIAKGISKEVKKPIHETKLFFSSLYDGQFDNRILGGGSFVKRVLGAAEAIGQVRSNSLEGLIGVFADYFGLDASQL